MKLLFFSITFALMFFCRGGVHASFSDKVTPIRQIFDEGRDRGLVQLEVEKPWLTKSEYEERELLLKQQFLSDEGSRLYYEGVRELLAKRWSDAKDKFEQAIKKEGHMPRIVFARIQTLVLLKQCSVANQAAQDAKDLGVFDLDFRVLMYPCTQDDRELYSLSEQHEIAFLLWLQRIQKINERLLATKEAYRMKKILKENPDWRMAQAKLNAFIESAHLNMSPNKKAASMDFEAAFRILEGRWLGLIE